MQITKSLLLLLLFQPILGGPAFGAQNNGSAQMGVRNSDEYVKREVRHELMSVPWYTVFDILQYSVSGGEVTLKGSVVNSTIKTDAENAVKHIEGVEKVNDQIEVLPPNGSLTPRVLAGDRPVTSGGIRLFVGFAAGCGITPLLCIARTLLADPAHRFILFYGNTNTSRTMCLEELLALKDKNVGRLALHFVMSREPQEVDLYNGRVDAARVRELAGTLFKPDEVAEYFVCGPGDMIDQVSAALRGLNVDADRIHSEHFTVAASAPGETAGIAVTAKAAATNGHATVVAEPATEAEVPADAAEVTVLMDGRRRSFTMRRNADTVLDAAARAGLDLPFSCRAGVCSTCRTKVVRGEVEMAQNYALEDWELEQGYVLACQATCKTPVLELDYDEK